MSTRRSARLSAALPAIKEDLVDGSPAPKIANTGRKRKSTAGELQPSGEDARPAPSTPKRKKPSVTPATPTPAAVGLMSAPYGSQRATTTPPPAVDRLAVPNGTNAPLISPESRRLVTNKPIDQVSPSKAPKTKTTTGNILEEALAHLIKVEPKLKPVIEKHPCHVFSPEGLAEEVDPFNSLVSGIISQQVRASSPSSEHECS